jgi:hypothetical protein
MSQQGANPEYLFHYERLGRERAGERRRAYWLLVGSGLLLIGAILLASMVPSVITVALVPLLLLVGFSLLLLWNGLAALRRSHQPIKDDEVAFRRGEERRQLFQFAQGHIPWRYWIAVIIEGVVGIVLLLIGGPIAWLVVTNLSSPHLLEFVFGFPLPLAGGYNLFKAVNRARLLRRLAALSSQELAARLSLGETTEGL